MTVSSMTTDRPHEVSTWATRFLSWIRPTQVHLSADGPAFLARQIEHQFEDELETRKLKAVQA